MNVYEYLRVFTSIYEYFWWIFTNTLYFTWSILLELLLLAPVISNFNFFHQWALILTFFTQKWLCYRMFGLGGNRIFIISTYRWVTRIFMTLHDQNGRWNTIFMNIKVFKNHDAPNFWWFSVIFCSAKLRNHIYMKFCSISLIFYPIIFGKLYM